MTPQCMQAVQAAAGRVLTPAQIKAIDDRMSATMRRIAGQDVQVWRSMSRDQQMLAAAAQAMADIQAEAARKIANAQLQVLKTADTSNRIDQQKRAYAGSNNAQALVHDIENSATYVEGIKNDTIRACWT
jgi:hypothetical protein